MGTKLNSINMMENHIISDELPVETMLEEDNDYEEGEVKIDISPKQYEEGEVKSNYSQMEDVKPPINLPLPEKDRIAQEIENLKRGLELPENEVINQKENVVMESMEKEIELKKVQPEEE